MTDKPPGALSLPFAGIKKNIFLLINPNENQLPRETSPFPQLAPRVMPDGELCLALHRRFSPAPTPHPAQRPPGAPKPAGLVTPTPNGRITGTRDSMVYVFFYFFLSAKAPDTEKLKGNPCAWEVFFSYM